MHTSFSDTLFTGQTIIELDRVDSTNNFAAKLLKEGKPHEGTVIMAHLQESGKGQGSNIWESAGHLNLTVSFIFYPVFIPADKQFDLNIAISLALYDYFEKEFGKRIKIKWPNDILADEKKITGILIENTISGKYLKSCIVGIGLNINQIDFGFGLKNAISKKIISGKDYNLKEELHILSRFLEARYLQLKAGKSEMQKAQFMQALYKYQELSEFESEGIIFRGKITEISPEGRLIVKKEDGTVSAYNFKEITFL